MKTLWNPSTSSIFFLYFLLKQENRAGCIIIKKKNLYHSNEHDWLNAIEWMNEWCIYIVLYCVLLYTQSALQSRVCVWGGLFSTTTTVQHPLGWWDGSHSTTASVRSPHSGICERDGANQVDGIIRRPWLTRASGGNLARTPRLYPYSLWEVSWDFFNDHRKSGPRFNVSSVGRCFLQYRVPVTIMVR